MTTHVQTVTAEKIAFEYPGRVVWQDLSFTLEPGSLTAMLGESGSGKTTLLQCLGSLERPTAGTLRVLGRDVNTLRGSALRQFRRECVGFVFQNAGLVASWSVRKNVEVGGYRVSHDPGRARDVFERFGLPFEYLDVTAHQLSGGEQQRVGLIRLALRNPPLMLLDEPTAALDDVNSARVTDFLEQHCTAGGIAVVATHDPRVRLHATDIVELEPIRRDVGRATSAGVCPGNGHECD